MIKSIFCHSLHIVTGFVQSLIKLCRLDWIALDYSILCRKQMHTNIALGYKKSRNVFHLLVNSTGLKFSNEDEWKCKKHGYEYNYQ